MRFLMLLKASRESEAGVLPTRERIDAVSRYNESLVKAGVLLDAAGLHPSSQGVRVLFHGDQRTVVNGPFAENNELVAGFWMIQVKSRAEAIEWARRCPSPQPGEDAQIELRQVCEDSDFPETSAPLNLSNISIHERRGVASG